MSVWVCWLMGWRDVFLIIEFFSIFLGEDWRLWDEGFLGGLKSGEWFEEWEMGMRER